MPQKYGTKTAVRLATRYEPFLTYDRIFNWKSPIYITEDGHRFLSSVLAHDQTQSALSQNPHLSEDVVRGYINNRTAWAGLLIDHRPITRVQYFTQTNEMYSNRETTTDHGEAEIFLAWLYSKGFISNDKSEASGAFNAT